MKHLIVHLIFCIFLLVSVSTAQDMLSTISNYKTFERLEEIQSDIYLSILDQRYNSVNQMDIGLFRESFSRSFSENGNFLIYNSEGSQDISILVKVDFLNFYKNSARNLFGKAVTNCTIKILKSKTLLEFPVSVNIHFDEYSLSDLEDDPQVFQKCQSSIFSNYIKLFKEKLSEVSFRFPTKLQITTFGYSQIIGNDSTNAKRNAIFNSLKYACEKILGVKIESSSRSKDFGDVEDLTKLTSEGYIKSYEVVDSYTLYTEDKFIFVVTKAIFER